MKHVLVMGCAGLLVFGFCLTAQQKNGDVAQELLKLEAAAHSSEVAGK